MSYIRAGHPMTYVDGNSKDYVFSDGERVVDYGSLTREGLVEIMCWFLDHKCDLEDYEKEYFMEQLSDRLAVKLRKEKLTPKQYYNRCMENVAASDMLKRLEELEKE